MFASITEAFKSVVNMNHKYNNIILDYLERMEKAKDILEAHVGKEILGRNVDNL